ncbi:MAG: hypothetical protein A3K67_04825 [Euryarchaeota archaeon RBG_16_62_10]|nr:MAG: hypothetical protein A3K67_04825 [Euryarchaeota archaeon RBG_16_62_10]
MAVDHRETRNPPSDLLQIPTVWRYELLRYLRSWRLLASVAVVIAILALLYLLPPALGQPYSGTDTDRKLYVSDFAGLNMTVPGMSEFLSFGALNRSVIDTDTLAIYVDGVLYPSNNSANWFFITLTFEEELPAIFGGTPKINAVVFKDDLTANEVTATYDWYTSEEDFDGLFLNFASFLAIICATFFAADSLVGEFQNRTGYLIFPNPIRREILYLGKFSASVTAGLVVMVIFYAGVTLLSMVEVRGVDDDFGISLLFSLEFLVAATAVAYLISAIMKGSTGSIVLTFLMFIIILPIIDSVSSFTGVKIDASLTFASTVINWIVIDPYPVDSSAEAFGYTFYSFYPAPSTAAFVMLAYIVLSMVVSLVLFKRKQLVG